ncbi:MAG TPA: serine hydrolase [Longimicrobiales bacterium]
MLALMLGALPLAGQQIPADSVIERVVRERVESGRAHGLVVGVLEAGQAPRFVAYGATGENGGAIDQHTIFEIGSISKTFTALLLADAVVRGGITLDQPVASLLPTAVRVPDYGGTMITLEHLATHRSGLPRLPTNLLAGSDAEDPYAAYDAAQLYEFLAGHELARAPGTRGEYSNLGAGLLGHALVAASGQPSWAALVESRITGPLGMTETFVDVPVELSDRMSRGHAPSGDEVAPWTFDALAGAGALRSSAADMISYLAAQLDPPVDSLGVAIRLTQEPRAEFGTNRRIGLGWMIRDNSDGRSVWWHNGGTGGFASLAAFDPARGVAVVVLSNGGVPVDDIGAWLFDDTLPLNPPPVPSRRAAIALPADHLERMVGEYPLAPQFVLTVTRDGDQLWLQATGQPRVRLWPFAPDRFFVREVAAEIWFELGETGAAAAAILQQNGRSQRAARRP